MINPDKFYKGKIVSREITTQKTKCGSRKTSINVTKPNSIHIHSIIRLKIQKHLKLNVKNTCT